MNAWQSVLYGVNYTVVVACAQALRSITWDNEIEKARQLAFKKRVEHTFRILVANPSERPHLGALFGEAHKSGLPSGGSRLSDQPGVQTREIEGCRSESLLQMGFGLASIASVT